MKSIPAKNFRLSPTLRRPANSVDSRLANAMMGRDVCLQVRGRPLSHGTVTAVWQINGEPMIIVNGACYDLRQVLTATPPQTRL
jgi:hypothetical protein